MLDFSLYNRLTAEAARDGIHQLVVGAVIAHDEHVLLLQRPESEFMGGIFELPSGKVEPGETLEYALKREVEEETGLPVETINTYLGSFDYLSGTGKSSRQFTFTVTVTTISPIILTEHDNYQWGGRDEKLPVTEAVKDILTLFRRQFT